MHCEQCAEPTAATALVLIQSRGSAEHLCDQHRAGRVFELEQALIPHTLVSTFQGPPSDVETIEILRTMLSRSSPELRAELQRYEHVAAELHGQKQAAELEAINLSEALAKSVKRCELLSTELEKCELATSATIADLRAALEAKTQECIGLEAQIKILPLEAWNELADLRIEVANLRGGA